MIIYNEQFFSFRLIGKAYDILDYEKINEEIFDYLLLSSESDFLIFLEAIIIIISFIILIFFVKK
jgi:hypothetical protein